MEQLDKKILDGMTGAERLRVLLRQAGFESYREFAIGVGRYVEEVSMCITGKRRYDEIRDELASALKLDRGEIDRMIDGEPVGAEEPAA